MAVYQDDKFIVIATKDLKRLPKIQQDMLQQTLDHVARIRESEGRPPRPKYFVANQDEPYAKQIIDIILKGEEEKQRNGTV